MVLRWFRANPESDPSHTPHPKATSIPWRGTGLTKKLVVKLAQFPYQSSQMHRVVPGINGFYPPMLWTH